MIFALCEGGKRRWPSSRGNKWKNVNSTRGHQFLLKKGKQTLGVRWLSPLVGERRTPGKSWEKNTKTQKKKRGGKKGRERGELKGQRDFPTGEDEREKPRGKRSVLEGRIKNGENLVGSY